MCISFSNIDLSPFQIDIHRDISPRDITDIRKYNKILADSSNPDVENISSIYHSIPCYACTFLNMFKKITIKIYKKPQICIHEKIKIEKYFNVKFVIYIEIFPESYFVMYSFISHCR